MASTTPTPTASFDCLQPELRLMIFEKLENNDLCNIRLTSRQLLGEANEGLRKRFLDDITILGTVSQVKQLHKILRLPFMAQSRLKIRRLRVDYPTPDNLTIENGVVVEDWLPSKGSARRLARCDTKPERVHAPRSRQWRRVSIPLRTRSLEENQEIAQIFLSALGSLKPEASNLTRLILDGTNFDGLDLYGALSSHSSSLRIVELLSCELTGDQIDPATWDLIFHKLHEMKLDELFMARLYDPDAEGPLVLHERSLSDRKAHNWSSINPRHKAPPVDRHGTRHHFSDYEEADIPGSVAIFSRWQSHLRHSWVKKGLEFLLGKGNHTLYQDPRDSHDILGE